MLATERRRTRAIDEDDPRPLRLKYLGWRNMKGNVYHATSTRQLKLMVIEGMSTYSVVITIVDGLINIGLVGVRKR